MRKLISDFSNKEIVDEKQSATITVYFGDGLRGLVVADAHVDDAIVGEIAKVGHQQARRGRRPKTDALVVEIAKMGHKQARRVRRPKTPS